LGVEEAYTQQGRAHSRIPHPDEAARPAVMSRAAHADYTPSKAKPWSASKSPSAHALAWAAALWSSSCASFYYLFDWPGTAPPSWRSRGGGWRRHPPAPAAPKHGLAAWGSEDRLLGQRHSSEDATRFELFGFGGCDNRGGSALYQRHQRVKNYDYSSLVIVWLS
jgi:hypothetical protein